MEIHNEIKKVHDYFVHKLVIGDFEPTEYNEHYIKVTVDGYVFCLWLSSNFRYFDIYNTGDNFMPLEFTEEQKEIIHKLGITAQKKMYDEKIKSKKIEEFNKLKQELGL